MKCRNKLSSTALNNNSIDSNSFDDSSSSIGSRMHLLNRLNIFIALFLIVLFIIYSLFHNIYYIDDNNSIDKNKHNNNHIRGFDVIKANNNREVTSESRLYDYCNRFIPKNDINTNVNDSEWKLVYFAATIRHGDRSAVSSVLLA